MKCRQGAPSKIRRSASFVATSRNAVRLSSCPSPAALRQPLLKPCDIFDPDSTRLRRTDLISGRIGFAPCSASNAVIPIVCSRSSIMPIRRTSATPASPPRNCRGVVLGDRTVEPGHRNRAGRTVRHPPPSRIRHQLQAGATEEISGQAGHAGDFRMSRRSSTRKSSNPKSTTVDQGSVGITHDFAGALGQPRRGDVTRTRVPPSRRPR